MSQITFPDARPAYCAAGPSLQCSARVGDHPATYKVTAEALESHFGARSYLFEDLLAAYDHHRPAIEGVARDVFEMTGSRNITLHSGHFRFGM